MASGGHSRKAAVGRLQKSCCRLLADCTGTWILNYEPCKLLSRKRFCNAKPSEPKILHHFYFGLEKKKDDFKVVLNSSVPAPKGGRNDGQWKAPLSSDRRDPGQIQRRTSRPSQHSCTRPGQRHPLCITNIC